MVVQLSPLWKLLGIVNATATSLSGLHPLGSGSEGKLPAALTANPMEVSTFMGTSVGGR